MPPSLPPEDDEEDTDPGRQNPIVEDCGPTAFAPTMAAEVGNTPELPGLRAFLNEPTRMAKSLRAAIEGGYLDAEEVDRALAPLLKRAAKCEEDKARTEVVLNTKIRTTLDLFLSPRPTTVAAFRAAIKRFCDERGLTLWPKEGSYTQPIVPLKDPILLTVEGRNFALGIEGSQVKCCQVIEGRHYPYVSCKPPGFIGKGKP